MFPSLEFSHVLDVARDYATVARYHAEGLADAVALARAEARLQLACAVWARAHVAVSAGGGAGYVARAVRLMLAHLPR